MFVAFLISEISCGSFSWKKVLGAISALGSDRRFRCENNEDIVGYSGRWALFIISM